MSIGADDISLHGHVHAHALVLIQWLKVHAPTLNLVHLFVEELWLGRLRAPCGDWVLLGQTFVVGFFVIAFLAAVADGATLNRI